MTDDTQTEEVRPPLSDADRVIELLTARGVTTYRDQIHEIEIAIGNTNNPAALETLNADLAAVKQAALDHEE